MSYLSEIKWYVRFCLLFVRAHYAMDTEVTANESVSVRLTYKYFKGKLYVVKQETFRDKL